MRITVTDNYVSCIKKVANAVKNMQVDIDRPIFVFSDDKMTLTVESEIAKALGGGFFGVEVLTLSRYISKRSNPDKLLSKESAVMVVRKLLSSGGKAFKCFDSKKVGQNLPLALYELISQLKSAKVTPKQLKEIVDNDNSVIASLKCKLFDIATVYESYENYLEERGYIDPCKYTSLMPDILRADDRIKGATVIICGFMSLTGQRKEIFETLKSLAGDFQAFLVGDEKYPNIYTQETINALKDKNTSVVQENGDLNPTAEILKRCLFSPEIYSEGFKKENADNLFLFNSSNPYEELERIAEDIKSAVIGGKIRYKDAVVVCGDKVPYSRNVDRIFREYEIPYYFDEQKTLDAHPLLTGTVAFLDLVRRGYKREDYLDFLSSIAFFTDRDLIDEFTNYILRYSLTGKALYTPFKREDENLEKFEEIRAKVALYGEKLKGDRRVKELVTVLKEVYEAFSVEENLAFLSERLSDRNEGVIADYNGKAYDKTLELLAQTEEILGDEIISVVDFKNLLKSGASATVLGVIPSYDDAVYVGDFESTKFRACKYLYAVGMNGNIPQIFSDTAMLTDGDLSKLDEFKIAVDPKIREVNRREKETVCVALLAFSEKIVISYVNTGFNGLPAVKSEIADVISRAFDIKTITRGTLLQGERSFVDIAKRRFLTKNNCVRELALLKSKENGREYHTYYGSVAEAVSTLGENVDLTLSKIKRDRNREITVNREGCFPNNYLSASTVESYYGCPYKNYAQHILRLQESKDGEIKANEFGIILHALAEEFVKRIDEIKSYSECDEMSDKLLEDITSSEQYKFYFENEKYEAYKPLLKREGRKIGRAMYRSIKDSSFTPLGSEIDFGYRESKYEAIKLSSGGSDYKIRGKIDRVDVCGDYFRIIDYKTGGVDAGDKAFYMGRKLQLYLYMNAIASEKLKPVGGYYFPIEDAFLKEGENAEKLMKGKTAKSEDIVRLMDKNVGENGSEIIPVIFTKSGIKDSASVIEVDEFESYMDYALKLTENAVKEIKEGYIEPTPYKDEKSDECKYCQYKAMCGYLEEYENKTRNCENITKSRVINAVRGGENK